MLPYKLKMNRYTYAVMVDHNKMTSASGLLMPAMVNRDLTVGLALVEGMFRSGLCGQALHSVKNNFHFLFRQERADSNNHLAPGRVRGTIESQLKPEGIPFCEIHRAVFPEHSVGIELHGGGGSILSVQHNICTEANPWGKLPGFLPP